LEKAIEIKRRAQRCILNGDLDGALAEYETLAALENSDPYNFVLLADLTFKRGDQGKAAERYLQAADSYEKSGLYKNAIAVCKKMIRLKLSAPAVLKRLAGLHALDGLATESALYWMQYAEHLGQEGRYKEAGESLRQAFETCPENIRALEKLAEVQILDGDNAGAARALAEAASHYQRVGVAKDADRCRQRAEQLQRGIVAAYEAEARSGKVREPASGPASAADWSLDPRQAAAADPQAVEGVIGGGIDLEPPAGAAPIERLATTDFQPGATRLPGLEDSSGVDVAGSSPAPPMGLDDEPAAPVAEAQAAPPPAPSNNGVADVEALLRQAEQEFRAGDRDAASRTLMRAAQGYEDLEKLESAAVIFRSLSKSPNPPPDASVRWFQNCERRGQSAEAAQVACEIGDRVLTDGEAATAVSWFERARELDPGNEHALRRLARLGQHGAAAAAPAPAPAPPMPQPLPMSPPAAAEAEFAPPEAASGGRGKLEVAMGSIDAVAPDLSALLSEFQRGVEALISDDAQSNYDLGMAYREMGLLDQALDCFRVAARSPAFAQRCAEMAGRSMLDQGLFDDAVEEFSNALSLPGLDAGTESNLRFQLGLAHEAAGRPLEALGEFERVYAQQANYPDVAQKIKALRRALENV
jgi:tetratricopeptide (TPR) repeat protein